MSGTPDFDYSPAAFEQVLGSRTMALIARAVAQAPAPSPRTVERVRLIVEPTVRQLQMDSAVAEIEQPLAA